jgi:DNA-binding YbaB/EbfC family protein
VFKGLGALGNLASLMRNASEMSSKFGQVSDELRQKRAIGEAGGGMVLVEVNGLGQVVRVRIEPELVANNEIDIIQDLLPAAFNQASARAKQMHVDAMKELTGGLSLPGMDDIIQQYTATGNEDSNPAT